MNWYKVSQSNEIYNFEEGEARAKRMSETELRYALRDLKEVIQIQEKSNREGHRTPKLGYYWDEFHTYLKELNDRKIARGEKAMEGGAGDGSPDSDFDQEALSAGVKIEMEHTDDPSIAKDITKDHLVEFDDYYTELPKMENKLKKKENKKK